MLPPLTGRIADAAGYRSESAFNKAFSKEMGVAPARYRRLQRAISDDMPVDNETAVSE